MVARSIRTRLTRGLLLVVAPALVGIGAASIALTARALDRADSDAARTRVSTSLRALRTELDEGDDLVSAAGEVIAAADAEGVRLALRDAAGTQQAKLPIPASALDLALGACTTFQDETGEWWRACAASSNDARAVAAVRIGAHRAALASLMRAMVLVILVTLLTLVWAIRRIVRGHTASLGELVKWSEHVGEDEPKPPAPPPADTEEVARLVASFDSVVKRLLEALARERANGAHIAHELRTPLTSILGELDAMPHVASTDPFVSRMRADVLRLARVIESILFLSRPPAHTKGAGVINLADLARELASKETVVDAPDEALIAGDPELVRIALQNLLENAAKYSGHAARRLIVSSSGGLEGEALVTVVDDGPGLTEEEREKMFERYWRASVDANGSGIGLALVRAVAERHGGKAHAAPNADGVGLAVAMSFAPILGWHESTPLSGTR